MLASYDWRVRHAGLMAIAAIGEGTGKVCCSLLTLCLMFMSTISQVMQNELGKIVEYVSSCSLLRLVQSISLMEHIHL